MTQETKRAWALLQEQFELCEKRLQDLRQINPSLEPEKHENVRMSVHTRLDNLRRMSEALDHEIWLESASSDKATPEK